MCGGRFSRGCWRAGLAPALKLLGVNHAVLDQKLGKTLRDTGFRNVAFLNLLTYLLGQVQESTTQGPIELGQQKAATWNFRLIDQLIKNLKLFWTVVQIGGLVAQSIRRSYCSVGSMFG